MSTEDSNPTLGERRRRRLESARAAEAAAPGPVPAAPSSADTADLAATGPISAVDDGGPPTAGGTPSRRQLREARRREEEARRAAEAGDATGDGGAAPEPDCPTPLAPPAPVRVARADRTASLPPVVPARPEAPAVADEESGATPSGRTPNRRSMRDRRVEGPAGPAGRGERVPAQRPIVRTPAAAQGIRRLDETGALTGVTSTRASEDSPVEVTGPLDWSSSLEVAPPAEPETPAAESPSAAVEPAPAPLDPAPPVVPPRASVATPPVDAVTPARRSVLSSGRTAPHAWESVSGEGRGAAVPQPEEVEVPDVEGVFDVAPEELEAEASEGIDVGSDDGARPAWVTWAGRILLALVGVGIGVWAYQILT